MAAAHALEDLRAYPPEAGISTVDNNSHFVLIPVVIEAQEPTHPMHISIAIASTLHNTGRPDVVQFAAIRDPKLQVVRAIPVRISTDAEHVIACWPEIDEFGTGETVSEALDDFGSGLSELCHELFALDAKLGPNLQNAKTSIERHIKPR